MGWDRRGYYYRARKVNGRVIREYIGAGQVATLAAKLDAIERDERDTEKATEKTERERWKDFDAPVDELDELVENLARAALLAAGYRQHKRGEWRKRRECRQETG